MFNKNVFIVFAVLLFSCEKDSGDEQNIYKKFDEPIISDNDFFIGSKWNDPYVISDNGTLVMYASADRNISEDIKIYRLISDDGENWQMNPDNAVFMKSSDPDA